MPKRYPFYQQNTDPPIVVHDHDVLSGRGVNIAHHPGNERFRTLVTTRADENYCTTYTASDKKAVAEGIIHHIQSLNPPGRFLKREGKGSSSRGLQGPWYQLTAKEVVKKTTQALRDCNRQDRTGYAAGVSMPRDVQRVMEQRRQSGDTVSRASSRSDTAAGAGKRSISPSVEHAAEWLKKQRTGVPASAGRVDYAPPTAHTTHPESPAPTTVTPSTEAASSLSSHGTDSSASVYSSSRTIAALPQASMRPALPETTAPRYYHQHVQAPAVFYPVAERPPVAAPASLPTQPHVQRLGPQEHVQHAPPSPSLNPFGEGPGTYGSDTLAQHLVHLASSLPTVPAPAPNNFFDPPHPHHHHDQHPPPSTAPTRMCQPMPAQQSDFYVQHNHHPPDGAYHHPPPHHAGTDHHGAPVRVNATSSVIYGNVADPLAAPVPGRGAVVDVEPVRRGMTSSPHSPMPPAPAMPGVSSYPPSAPYSQATRGMGRYERRDRVSVSSATPGFATDYDSRGSSLPVFGEGHEEGDPAVPPPDIEERRGRSSPPQYAGAPSVPGYSSLVHGHGHQPPSHHFTYDHGSAPAPSDPFSTLTGAAAAAAQHHHHHQQPQHHHDPLADLIAVGESVKDADALVAAAVAAAAASERFSSSTDLSIPEAVAASGQEDEDDEDPSAAAAAVLTDDAVHDDFM